MRIFTTAKFEVAGTPHSSITLLASQISNLMVAITRDRLTALVSLTGILAVLLAVAILVLSVFSVLFSPFPAPQPTFLTSNGITAIGLVYSMVGATLISYEAITGTGVLAQLSWYLKGKHTSKYERWLMVFYLLKPPLKEGANGSNPILNEIEQGRDMKNADVTERAVGEPRRAVSEYDQFREIQRPAVVTWGGFVLLSLGFAMQFIAIYLPE